MTTPAEIEKKFWKALKSDRTVMLGVAGAENGHTRPMTAQLDGDEGPIWFFGSKDSALANNLGAGGPQAAVMAFAAKDHDLFASVHGSLSVVTDRAMVERLWNPFVAAWYTGKDDPKLLLMRLNPSEGQIWLDGSSVMAGIKMILGIDPKDDYKDKVAKVDLS
ncbi:MAG: pyridoxamine 5'-phosphate oxidase family protein [Chitinophagaceae bacterium]|nr:pyridoxamine 5'-phosphate oxidase family protein [Rubrivivax sp.]